MSILSGFRFWLPAAFARGGYFGRDCGMDARVVVIGVVVPPAVVCLFGDLTGSQPARHEDAAPDRLHGCRHQKSQHADRSDHPRW